MQAAAPSPPIAAASLGALCAGLVLGDPGDLPALSARLAAFVGAAALLLVLLQSKIEDRPALAGMPRRTVRLLVARLAGRCVARFAAVADAARRLGDAADDGCAADDGGMVSQHKASRRRRWCCCIWRRCSARRCCSGVDRALVTAHPVDRVRHPAGVRRRIGDVGRSAARPARSGRDARRGLGSWPGPVNCGHRRDAASRGRRRCSPLPAMPSSHSASGWRSSKRAREGWLRCTWPSDSARSRPGWSGQHPRSGFGAARLAGMPQLCRHRATAGAGR